MAVVSASLYGTVGYYGTKIINSQISIHNMLFWRFCISFLVMGSILYISPPLGLPYKNLLSPKILLLSVCYAISTSCCFFASQRLGIGMAMTIFFIFPAFNVLFAWMKNKNAISANIILSILLCLSGIFLIAPINQSDFHSHMGIFFSIIAAFSFALYLFLTKKYACTRPTYSTLSLLLGNTLLFFITSIVRGGIAYPKNIEVWNYTFILAIISTIIPTFLMIFAMKKISSTKIAITSVFEPICALTIGSVLLAERISTNQLIGIVILISASIIIQIDKSPQNV